ncbi:OST3 [Scenedesmus sp. PABB004]|nr:OST3 [Scenedesmus sp. PABB004]
MARAAPIALGLALLALAGAAGAVPDKRVRRGRGRRRRGAARAPIRSGAARRRAPRARAPAAARAAQVAELVRRRDAARDAVLVFSSADFDEFAAAPGRDYHLMFFLNANYMAKNAQMNLPKLRAEYALAAQAFRRGPDADRIFFVELIFERTKDVIKRLGVNSLPFAFHWDPAAVVKEGRSIKLAKTSECAPRIQAYPWPAEDIVRCAADTSGLSGGEVDRPSVLKHPLFPLLVLAVIVFGGAAAWKLYCSPLVRITGLWALGALGVYWFSTSGGMYNIIRGMPLYYTNQQGKTIWWMEGRSGQLGAEGFLMGSSYIFFSATLASLSYVVPRIRSDGGRAVTSLVLVLLSAFAAMRILATYQGKTGISMRTFF